MGLAVALGCAPMQPVALDVEPDAAALFVDGEAVEGRPAVIELRADRDHKLYFKSEGYVSELVVLRTRQGEDGPRLEPDPVKVRLRSRSRGGSDVRIEREEGDD